MFTKAINGIKDGYVAVVDFEVAHPHYFLAIGSAIIFALVAMLVF